MVEFGGQTETVQPACVLPDKDENSQLVMGMENELSPRRQYVRMLRIFIVHLTRNMNKPNIRSQSYVGKTPAYKRRYQWAVWSRCSNNTNKKHRFLVWQRRLRIQVCDYLSIVHRYSLLLRKSRRHLHEFNISHPIPP